MKHLGLAVCVCLSLVPPSKAEQDHTAVSFSPTGNTELMLHVPSPDWSEQIVYFLLVDRFNDGDPSNNDQGKGEFVKGSGSHFNGGDIQGVIDQLDYIQGLGSTTIWMTPVVMNQWWKNDTQYGGYHGYWATDFSKVDPHFGDLLSYQRLSDALHQRGMYLIQDIVVNHTATLFTYDGEYDPQNTAVNFKLLTDERFPVTQSPFDKFDRYNPEHAAANIYNWTPIILDFANEQQQFSYQLGRLADINTHW